MTGNSHIEIISWSNNCLVIKGLSEGSAIIRIYNEKCNVNYFTTLSIEHEIPETQEPSDSNDNGGTEEQKTDEADDVQTDETDTKTPDSPTNPTQGQSASKKSAQYFWGTWQRMDNGEYYVIGESSVSFSEEKYAITSASETSLSVATLGTFSKQTDSVMVNNSIPYFRKGGTNLEYTMKLVGFEDSVARAASSTSLAGYTVTGKSSGYKSYESTSASGSDGSVTLTAPVSGDTQTVTVTSGSTTIAVVPGITVETNGSNMGTIPLSEEGQYSLKVTGTIDESEKDDGYMYGNNYKSYPMTLSITNVSDVTSETSAISITPQSNLLDIQSPDGSNLNLITVSTLKSKMAKTISLAVTCDSLTDAYIDTGINVTITNLETGKNWVDFIPLRFHRGLVPITVAAKSTEGNADAALNGFIIYPDGNSNFFTVPDGGDKTLYVPSFGENNKYLLSFSGATVEGELSTSTEMFYSVNYGRTAPFYIVIPDNITDLIAVYSFGEPNNLETSAFPSSQNFTAYLKEGDIDFYTMGSESSGTILPGGIQVYDIRYVNQKGTAPTTVSVQTGYEISRADLPNLADITGYNFGGWYMGGYKVELGYTVKSNITLTAKWLPIEYAISYELDGGTNASENPECYTIESDTIMLAEPTREGYAFNGWYETEDFSEEAVTSVVAGSVGDKTFYASWSRVSEISFTVDEMSDITVTTLNNANGSTTFTASRGYDTYSWSVDGEEKSTSRVFTVKLSDFGKGIYELVLEAKKGDDYYSYFAQLEIND